MELRQKLVRVEPAKREIFSEERPDKVWLVSEDVSLPFRPIHGVNAVLEESGHDWWWANGILHSNSHGVEQGRGYFLLIEYPAKDSRHRCG